MQDLNLDRINQCSPYKVGKEKTGVFLFKTDAQIVYTILFKEDMEIAGCQSYQFIIDRTTASKGRYDDNVRKTIISVIYEFFESNNNILLYICDTSDGREAARNKLFIKWFTDAADTNKYSIKATHVQVEDEVFYTAIILKKDHPQYEAIIEEFDFVATHLSDKP